MKKETCADPPFSPPTGHQAPHCDSPPGAETNFHHQRLETGEGERVIRATIFETA